MSRAILLSLLAAACPIDVHAEEVCTLGYDLAQLDDPEVKEMYAKENVDVPKVAGVVVMHRLRFDKTDGYTVSEVRSAINDGAALPDTAVLTSGNINDVPLQAGDVIYKIGAKTVLTPEDVYAAIDGQDVVTLTIKRAIVLRRGNIQRVSWDTKRGKSPVLKCSIESAPPALNFVKPAPFEIDEVRKLVKCVPLTERSSFITTSETTAIPYLAIAVDDVEDPKREAPSHFLRLTTSGEDWLFAKSVVFKIGNKLHTIDAHFEHEVRLGEDPQEWTLLAYEDLPRDVSAALNRGDEMTIRFEGRTRYRDLVLSPYHRACFKAAADFRLRN